MNNVMSSEKTPPPEVGEVHGCGCSCGAPDPRPDSTTQRQHPAVWDAEAIDALGHYHRYMLESLKDNFDKVMTLARRAAAVEQEKTLYCKSTQAGRRQQRGQQ